MNNYIKKYNTPLYIERREELQRVLFQLYEEDLKTGKNKEKKKPYTYTELGKKINVDQSDVSRILAGYKIDWSDEYKIKEKPENENESNENNKKTDELTVEELTKNMVIMKPSTFFISVGLGKRNQLEKFLLKHFRSSKDKLGIIHIINIKNPSGLLVFSDDHNLEYILHDTDYLKQIVNDAESTEKKDTIDN